MPCSTAVCILSNKVEVWSAEIAKPAEVTFFGRGFRSPGALHCGEKEGRKKGREEGRVPPRFLGLSSGEILS